MPRLRRPDAMDCPPDTDTDPGAPAGIGLRPPHLAALLRGEAAVDLVEVHAENHLAAGGPGPRALARVRERWPLTVHGVGLSIGGAAPLEAAHLARVAALVERVEPLHFSEHLAWSGHAGRWFNDLLPLPYDAAALQRVCDHVDQVQQALRRPMLLENPSRYLGCAASTMDEADFLVAVVRRTGCRLLLDLTNALVTAVNQGGDAAAFIDALPADAVAQYHLAGCTPDRDALGAPLLIDSHARPVDEAVWALYARALRRFGPQPTVVERDQDLPPLPVLAAEADRARALMRASARRAAADRPTGGAGGAGAPGRPAAAALRPVAHR